MIIRYVFGTINCINRLINITIFIWILISNQSGVARKHPQSAYVGLQKSLQHNWAFLQWITPGIGYAFGPVEQALWETFIPALFQGLGDGTPGQGVTRLPVKQEGLALPDPTKTVPEN